MAALPYVTAPGNIEKALRGIKTAATPESVSQDFVKTILGIKGGSGNQITAYLKKIGLATAQALKTGYGPLYVRNEYMHKLSDEELKGLIVEETGAEQDSNVVSLTIGCIKNLKKFAKWDAVPIDDTPKKPITEPLTSNTQPQQNLTVPPGSQPLGLNLGYTINLNLPATSDPAVFNAIFRALKEHLLKTSNE